MSMLSSARPMFVDEFIENWDLLKALINKNASTNTIEISMWILPKEIEKIVDREYFDKLLDKIFGEGRHTKTTYLDPRTSPQIMNVCFFFMISLPKSEKEEYDEAIHSILKATKEVKDSMGLYKSRK